MSRSHETVHQFRVNAADVGGAGIVEAGTLLEWIDTAGYATAAQWCGGHCVAASVGNFHLRRPIGVGELVEIRAALVYTGHTSMHMLITVSVVDLAQLHAPQTAQCAIIFVAFDDAGAPVDVPQWTPSTMLEMQRHRQARARIRMRRRIEDVMDSMAYPADGVALRFRGGSTEATDDGKVRGGRVMRWIDEAAYACGVEWVGADVVTSYVTGIRLHRPVFVGDAAGVTARVIHTGPRSVHIGVHVVVAGVLVANAVVVVASLAGDGGARPVAQWRPGSDDDGRLDRLARDLVELRQYLEPFSAALVA